MRTLVKVHKKITSSTGQITHEPSKYFLREAGGSCSQDTDVFNALSDSAKTALPTVQPTTTTSWNDRGCGSVTQPAVVTAMPDIPFTVAGAHYIQVAAGNFSGGNLVFTGIRGDNDPLRDGITFDPSTLNFYLPATLTDEWYILQTVATNSAGSIGDVFAVHLIYNAPVESGVDVSILASDWEDANTTPEVPNYTSQGDLGETYTTIAP